MFSDAKQEELMEKLIKPDEDTSPPAPGKGKKKKKSAKKEQEEKAVVDLKKAEGGDEQGEETEEEKAFEYFYFIWALFYMIGFLVHCRKKFTVKVLINGGHILAYITTYHRKHFSNVIFMSFLAWCFYSAAESSPNNANHHNMCGFVSLLLLPQQIRRVWNGGNAKKAGTAHALNVVRLAIIIMYMMAGFHKLNTDFFNPDVSCAFNKVNKYFKLFGIQRKDYKNLPWFFQTIPHQVIMIEFIPPLLLCFRKTQRLAVMILIMLHLVLLPVNFADFGSIAQSFLFLFISPLAATKSGLPKNFYIDMAWAFLAFEAITMVIWYQVDSETVPLKNEEVALVFLAYAVFWGSTLRTSDKKYPGPKLYRPKSFLSCFALVFFVWFAMNPYFGLRTVGCLTMFSNLRTEGPTSNHLLLGNNQLKIFSYQEDVVEAIKLDKRLTRKMDEGEILPRVTFETDVAQRAMKKGYTNASMTILYNGTVMETTDFLNDPDFAMFRQPHPLWQRKWIDFRHIQKEGPQKCVW